MRITPGDALQSAPSPPRLCSSVSERIRAYYEALRGAGEATACINADLSVVESVFIGPTRSRVLKFVLTAGGGCLSRDEHLEMASVLRKVEADAGDGLAGHLSIDFPTSQYFVKGVRREQNRVLCALKWMGTSIEVNGVTYPFYHRDLIEAGIDSLRGADNLELLGGRLPTGIPGRRRRSGNLNSYLFLKETEDVQRLHGVNSRVLATYLHADEAWFLGTGRITSFRLGPSFRVLW